MLARPVKNVQLNLKVTAQFKTRVAAAAVADRCSVTALIEAAVNEYLRGRQK
jgi:predicted HicB family RNase H-like nuclease